MTLKQVLVVSTIAVVIFVGAIWHFAGRFEDQATDAIGQLVKNIHEGQDAATNGVLGSDVTYARHHWKKTSGIFDSGFVMDRMAFSHRTGAWADTKGDVSVILVHGHAGSDRIALEVVTAGPDILDWSVRLPDNVQIPDEAIARGCYQAYAVVDGLQQPSADWRPPWVEFPGVPRYSIDWYQPEKHEFILLQGQSWSLLGQNERDEIVKEFPLPRSWRGWYESLGRGWGSDPFCLGSADSA